MLAAVTLVVGVVAGTTMGAPDAAGSPLEQYVGSIRCDTPNPWPMAPLRTLVDVYTDVVYPSDGLPGPAIELKANGGAVGPVLELTSVTTVRWHNATTGRRGTVRVPSRSHRVDWTAVIHPGHGRVEFTIDQKIGAMAFNPMVNPQFSRCRGKAEA